MELSFGHQRIFEKVLAIEEQLQLEIVQREIVSRQKSLDFSFFFAVRKTLVADADFDRKRLSKGRVCIFAFNLKLIWTLAQIRAQQRINCGLKNLVFWEALVCEVGQLTIPERLVNMAVVFFVLVVNNRVNIYQYFDIVVQLGNVKHSCCLVCPNVEGLRVHVWVKL